MVASSVRLEGVRLLALLNRTNDGRQFKLGLSALVDRRLRLTLDELSPLRNRFFPADALDGDIVEDKLALYYLVLILSCSDIQQNDIFDMA